MQSIASVVVADLRARQIEQTLWGPTQHERPPGNTPMKKRERRNQHRSLAPSSSCGPAEPTKTSLRASICPDDLRKDPRDPGYFDKLRYFTRCGAAATLSADRKSTRLNSSHGYISYAVFCLKKKKTNTPCYVH